MKYLQTTLITITHAHVIHRKIRSLCMIAAPLEKLGLIAFASIFFVTIGSQFKV